jgi:hypothetical protein
MALMPPRKPKPPGKKTVKPTPNRSGVPLHIYIPPAIRQAMDDCATANRRKLTQEVLIALEEHLKRQNRMPPEEVAD